MTDIFDAAYSSQKVASFSIGGETMSTHRVRSFARMVTLYLDVERFLSPAADWNRLPWKSIPSGGIPLD
jgi:hypothetical protein